MTWWYCAVKDDAEKYLWVDAERWFDARRIGWQYLGSESIWVTHPKVEQTRPPKNAYKDHRVFVARWLGSACGLNDLHMEVTRVPVKKLVCLHCRALLWPWELEETSGRLTHDVGDNIHCGPVEARLKARG